MKSDRRRLAERIAAEKNIKVRSAMRYLQRAAAPAGKERIKAPRYSGLSDSLRKAAKRQTNRIVKARTVKKPDLYFEPIVERPRRANYGPDDTRIVGIMAEYDFYGSDKRKRQIRLKMKGDELNAFLNAGSVGAALDSLTRVEGESFLKNATVRDLEFFTVEGQRHGPDYFS